MKSGLFDNPAVAACEARINILQNKINNLEEDNGRLQAKLDTHNNYLLPKATKEAKEMIDHNHFDGVRIVTWEQWNNRGEKSMNIPGIQKCQDEYEKLLKESPLHGTIDKICKDIIEQKNNAMEMEFTRIICDLLKRYGVYVHRTETKFGEEITTNSIEEQYGVVFDSMDFSQHDKEFTDKIKELQLEVDKYRKAFEDAKKERGCQVCGYRKEIDELTAENAELHCELQAVNAFQEGYPTEPIKVAEMLINAEGEYEHNPLEKAFCGTDKGTYRIFEISELRQIAEHLLVYCNHNKEEEE